MPLGLGAAFAGCMAAATMDVRLLTDPDAFGAFAGLCMIITVFATFVVVGGCGGVWWAQRKQATIADRP